MPSADEQQTYITLGGELLRYIEPDAVLAAFLARVVAATADPSVDYLEMVGLIYSPDNPLLVRGSDPEHATVPLATFGNPLFHLMLDLLERKRRAIGSRGSEQGSSSDDRARASGGLEFRMGSEEGRSFFIKAPSFESRIRLENGAVEATCPQFERVAVKLTSKRTDGTKSCRMLVLEPATEHNEHGFGQFFVRGSFVVVEKINNPAEAARRFREFEPC